MRHGSAGGVGQFDLGDAAAHGVQVDGEGLGGVTHGLAAVGRGQVARQVVAQAPGGVGDAAQGGARLGERLVMQQRAEQGGAELAAARRHVVGIRRRGRFRGGRRRRQRGGVGRGVGRPEPAAVAVGEHQVAALAEELVREREPPPVRIGEVEEENGVVRGVDT
ncbi:MAG: hypothetical protein IPM94_15275 [bacterium]|nr:hypothetical protein [bacterium]